MAAAPFGFPRPSTVGTLAQRALETSLLVRLSRPPGAFCACSERVPPNRPWTSHPDFRHTFALGAFPYSPGLGPVPAPCNAPEDAGLPQNGAFFACDLEPLIRGQVHRCG